MQMAVLEHFVESLFSPGYGRYGLNAIIECSETKALRLMLLWIQLSG